ncbi:MAG: T9SS type A sorting domain-containing protein, partial [Bacteroidota bacterium]
TVAASVSIAASPSGAICTGTSVTFTATPANGGTPTYQWQLNGSSISGTTNSLYTSSTLANGDAVTCIMISSIACVTGSPATSNIITMVVNTASTASVLIAASPSGSICSGTSVTFTATPTNGGTAPAYQWKKNGTNISGATNSTYTSSTLTNGDVISCVMTSNAGCVTGSPATSNQITMTVSSAVAASVTITASPSVTICSGDSVIFTATATNGGPTPSFQWQLNGTNVGPNSSTVSTTAMSNGDVVTCIMTSSLTCATGSPATSNSLTMSVYTSLTVDVSISAVPSGSICSGTNVIFTATSQNPGTSPIYQWQVNGVNIGANYPTFMTNALSDGDIVTCTLTSSSSCAINNPAYSNPITMDVSSALPAGITIGATSPIPVCEGESVSFTATPANEGTSPVYQWQINSSNAGTNSPSFTYNSFTDGDVVTCILTSSLSCASGNPATSNSISVTVYPAPAVPVVTQTGDTLYSSYPGDNQWYYSNILGGFAISGATGEYYVPVITGDYYVIAVDTNGCFSDTSNVYIIIIGGIGEAENPGITLYPNPSNGNFEINYQSVTGDNADMRLVNSIGQILLERYLTANSVSKIDASFLSQGMYFMKLTTNKTTYLYKVLITK